MKHMRQILAFAMALVLLTGCSAGPAPQSSAPAGTTAPAETTLPAETAQPAETTQPTETTQPPETTAATEPPAPQPGMKQVELTEEGRYEINIFLSNFSEQQFQDTYWHPEHEDGFFRSADADAYEILFFVWNNVNYNTYDGEQVKHDGEYYIGFSLDTINARSARFFGRTFTREEVEHAGGDIRLINGLVCRPEAWGDTYEEMTVVDGLYDLGDGTMRADFTVYSPTLLADYDGVVSTGGINQKFIYYYTPEEAVASGYFEPYRKGTALVKPKTLDNGRESYELVTYELLK